MNYRPTTLFILIVLLVSAIGAYGYVSRSLDAKNGKDVVPPVTTYECNGDGYICPDGSIVGRTGPACEFSSCPGVLPATSTAPHATGILYGRVTLSPVCPVESIPPTPECAPKPYVTDIRVYTLAGKDTGTVTRTTSNGTFVLDIFPGSYSIRAVSGTVYPRCEEKQVTITRNSSITIELSCDTGIR